MLSADDGHAWDNDGELVFYVKTMERQESGMQGKRDFGDYLADMNIWTFGHPAAVQLVNGEVLVAYYAGDSAAIGIHWVRIALTRQRGGKPYYGQFENVRARDRFATTAVL
jgi:hypothetical protein